MCCDNNVGNYCVSMEYYWTSSKCKLTATPSSYKKSFFYTMYWYKNDRSVVDLGKQVSLLFIK